MSESRQQQPIVTKNEYFTYVDGARSSDQIWNIEGLEICLQGGLPVFGQKKTYFAKKHMLTFHGGKMNTNNTNMSSEEGVWYKSNNIRNKRLHHSIRPQEINPGNSGKYGSTKIGAAEPDPPCTFIVCDYFWERPERLREMIADRLRMAVKQHEKSADIWFKGLRCVVTVTNGKWEWTDNCRVTFDVSEDGKSFMLVHLMGL